MIIIISSKYDITTKYVEDWLISLDQEFKIFYSEDFQDITFLAFGKDNTFKVNDLTINKEDVIWHRRGRLRLLSHETKYNSPLNIYLKKEENALIKSLELYLKNFTNYYIGSFLAEDENYKLNQLYLAELSGFKIPESLVTTKKLSF